MMVTLRQGGFRIKEKPSVHKTPRSCREDGRGTRDAAAAAEGEKAARNKGDDSSDSSIHDAAKQGKAAAAARLGGGATHAHILRTRLRCSLLRRRGHPLSSLVISVTWLTGIAWRISFGWPSFVEDCHGAASPWAEATEGASMRRIMLT